MKGEKRGERSSSERQPKEIELSDVWRDLRSYGIVGIGTIGFDRDTGFHLKSYAVYNDPSHLIKEMKRNPAIATEMSVMGKYLREFKTCEGVKGLLSPYTEKNELLFFEMSNNKGGGTKKLLDTLSRRIKKGTAKEVREKIEKLLSNNENNS